jgi:hypothetical protein
VHATVRLDVSAVSAQKTPKPPQFQKLLGQKITFFFESIQQKCAIKTACFHRPHAMDLLCMSAAFTCSFLTTYHMLLWDLGVLWLEGPQQYFNYPEIVYPSPE